MTKHADVSLESDDLDGDLEKEAPPPPVMVVQYKKRGIPAWIAFPLIMSVPIISILIYHRLVVEPYRSRAAEAERVLDEWTRTARPGMSAAGQGSTVGGTASAGLVTPAASVPGGPVGNPPAVAAGAAPAQPALAVAPASAIPGAQPSSPAPGASAPAPSVAQASPNPAPSPASSVAASPGESIAREPVPPAFGPETGSPAKTGAQSVDSAKRLASAAGDQKDGAPALKANPQSPAAAQELAKREPARPPASEPPLALPADMTTDRSPDDVAPRPKGGVHTRGLGPIDAASIDRPTENDRQNGALEPVSEQGAARSATGLPPLPTREESLRNRRRSRAEAGRARREPHQQASRNPFTAIRRPGEVPARAARDPPRSWQQRR